ncbi:MAG: WecB/TagA/CpsF family glycosyltransferase [Halanaerobiaceae bacterium]|nr:WecB/TagA/CpsF family glycosyltransferase [Halanaerobiaceae bacterium]
MAEYIKILGIRINNITMKEAVEIIDNYVKDRANSMIVTPNAEMIVRAQKDRELAEIINNSALSVPDGAGVLLASKLLRNPVAERVAGIDLMKESLKLAAERAYSVYLLGSKPGVVDTACRKIREQFPAIKITGSHHGYLDKDLKKQLVEELKSKKPDILYVGMGSPLQEKFLNEVLPLVDIGAALAVGGSFDVLAGKVRRAPVWMQKAGLEWLFRLIQEPERVKRMTALPLFVFLVLRELFRRKKHITGCI